MASRSSRFVAAAVLVLHLLAGITAGVMLPHGFDFNDLHMWSNTVIPAVAMLAVVAAFVGLLIRSYTAGVQGLIAAAAGGWTSAVFTGVLLFPVSITGARAAVPTLVAVALLAIAWWANDRLARAFAAAACGAVLGFVVILAQRAPLPSTRPLGGFLAQVHGAPTADTGSTEQLLVPCGSHTLQLNPVLTFTSRSPDRTWTVLAPGPHGSHRKLTSLEETPTELRAAFRDDGESTLVVRRDESDVRIEAVSTLHSPVYAHLDSFTTIQMTFDATIAFGPTGTTRFPIEPADYPAGRPVKLGYLDEDHVFRVVRAGDAEKAPYTELGAGPLERGAPISLEIRPRDGSDAGCRVTFDDWSAQLSTEPSPTAGSGVPQGSIQFFSRDGVALVAITLADTGPGRGFDSVGHAAGTYLNRMHVEPLR